MLLLLLLLFKCVSAANYTHIHVPKTGGTAVEKWLKKNGVISGFSQIRLGEFSNNWPRVRDGIKSCALSKWNTQCCSDWHVALKPTANKIAGPFFTVLRHPLSKIQSELAMRKISCKRADDYLHKQLRLFVSSNRTLSDCHWLPQSDFVTERNGDVIEDIKIFCYNDPKLDVKMNRLFPQFKHKFTLAHKQHKHCALNQASRFLIRLVYKKDFEIYDRFCV